MTITITEVRQALADALSVVPDLAANPWPSDQVLVNTAQIARTEFDPRLVFSGAKVEHTFRVTVFAGRGAEVPAAEWLDSLCELTGSTSLIAAVQDGNNWSIAVDYAEVVRCGEILVTEAAGVSYLSVSFDVKVVW